MDKLDKKMTINESQFKRILDKIGKPTKEIIYSTLEYTRINKNG